MYTNLPAYINTYIYIYIYVICIIYILHFNIIFKLLKHDEQKSKSAEAGPKNEFKKKVEWFKENRMVEKLNQKSQDFSRERNNERKEKSAERTTKKKTK